MLILLLFITGGYLLGTNTIKPSSIPSPTAIPVTTSVPSSIQKTEFKTFSKLGVFFQYPKNITISQEDSNDNEPSASVKQNTIRFSIGNKNFTLERLSDSSENEAPFNQTSITKNFNGNTWRVFLPSQTTVFCDAGNCGKTAPSYYTYKNGYRYSFNYFSDDLQPTIENILSTFTFTQ